MELENRCKEIILGSLLGDGSLKIAKPYLRVVSMLSKVILLYKDQNLQKRWISEVCKLTKFSRQIIEKHLVKKRQKWQIFRE